jgi:hypothetical protein
MQLPIQTRVLVTVTYDNINKVTYFIEIRAYQLFIEL